MIWRCPFCGGPWHWENDYSYDDYGLEGEGIVQEFSCPKCGRDITVFEAFRNEEAKHDESGDA